jgi:Uma2 family endonuclease
MLYDEIVLPETKPETEWVRGRALQKVSPNYWHAALQGLMFVALHEWAHAGCFGRVGTEWRFRVTPPGGVTRPLVPDVAYLSYAALPAGVPPELFQVPLACPTVAVEILSPDDWSRDVAEKIDTYLAAGSAAVLVIDPDEREITVHERSGPTTLQRGEALAHSALPGFRLDVATLFDRALR